MTDATSAPKRVLWLIRGLGPGGAEQLLASSAQVADQSRFRYLAAYMRPDKTHLVDRLESYGVPTRLLTGDPVGPLVWPLRMRTLMAQADVVHAHSPLLAGVARILARTIRPAHRPLVISTEHNEWLSFSPPTRILNAVTSPLDDHRFAVSERVRDSMRAAAQRGTEVLVHGVVQRAKSDLAAASPDLTRAGLGLRSEDVVAITVANFRREKDYPNLLKAAAIAIRQEPRLHVLVVGQGPLEAGVRRVHAELGLAGRVHLLGFRSDVADLLAASDVFLLGSAHEGLPVAVMEAMTAGLPIVATDVGGVADAVQAGVCGLIVDPRSPEALAEATLTLVQDPNLREQMSAHARERATLFDIRTAVARQEEVYAGITSRRGN